MTSKMIKVNAGDFKKLTRDVEAIKTYLLPLRDDEGELTDWAKKELARARATPLEDHISMERIEEEFLK